MKGWSAFPKTPASLEPHQPTARTCGTRSRVGQRERMSQRSWWLCGNFARIHARAISQMHRKLRKSVTNKVDGVFCIFQQCWIVSILPLIFNSTNIFSRLWRQFQVNRLQLVSPSTLYYSSFSSLARSKYLSIFSLFFVSMVCPNGKIH